MWIFAAEGPNGFFIPGDVKELYYGGAAFLIVFALFLIKGVPVIKDMLNNRTKRIEDALSAAEKAQADADSRIAEQQAKFANKDAEARQIVEDAHSQAAKLKADSGPRIESEIADMRAKNESEIVALSSQASSDVQAEFNVRTLEAAEAVVTENLDDAALQDLIEQYITDVGTAS